MANIRANTLGMPKITRSTPQLSMNGQKSSSRNLASGREALLDIGCGDSKITAQLASSLPGGCVVGIDNSEGMVDLARRNFPQTAYPNLHFQRMNVQSLDFQDQFDRVFSNAALHWVIDQRPVLKGVQRSLKAGGSLLFQMGQRQRSRNTRSHRRAYA
ncbi:MAG TPA: class I SAM-dependent methyltransferase [Candidatus Bathyarchaeia archaeon]|nr:class I SAM-dependent methyltransferase [Candidatus Bathyarchaeia archaeon]